MTSHIRMKAICTKLPTTDDGSLLTIGLPVIAPHLDGEDVGVLDEESLHSESLAERCRLIDGTQSHSLVCVEATSKFRSVRGNRCRGRGGEGEEAT